MPVTAGVAAAVGPVLLPPSLHGLAPCLMNVLHGLHEIKPIPSRLAFNRSNNNNKYLLCRNIVLL